MPHIWDDLMKMLARANPQDLLSFLLKDTCYLADITHELKVRSVTADYLCKANRNGEEIVVHVEFQRSHHKNMGRRMWEYNSVIAFLTDLPVYSFVLYLCKDNSIVEPPYRLEAANGDVLHIFNYQNIFLWEVLPEELLQSGLAGLLPLLPLTKGAGEARDAVVAAMIDGLRQADKEDILALGYAFAGLVYNTEADQQWLKRRFAMFEELLEGSWSYQEMVQKGIDKGLELGIEIGKKQGIEEGLNALRPTLVSVVEARFPKLTDLARQQGERFTVPELLSDVIGKLLKAQTAEQARQILMQLDQIPDTPHPDARKMPGC
jgi:predicted transposase YdaD